MTSFEDSILISKEEEGQRLDKILSARFKDIHSRTYFEMLFEEGRIFLNGKPIIKRIKPIEGDEIFIHFVLTPEIGLEPEPIPLDILYEDDHLIAINKPVGMVVHPAAGNWTGTFVNALLYHCKQLGEQFPDSKNTLRPGIVHRLDKDTSGVLIAAKTSIAHRRLIDLFSSKQIYKEYLAICVGHPGNARFEGAIGRHPIHRKQMTVVEEGGKSAITSFQTIGKTEQLSLVKIVIETGRTHQIRVHMKHLGFPVLGDPIYGSSSINAKYGVSHQMLHANKLEFIHPISNVKLSISAKPPQDMQKWITKILNN